MADDRKEDEATIKVASKKNPSTQATKAKTRVLKLKDKLPKIKEPGDYERGHVAEDQKKAKAAAAAAIANRAPSPSGAINGLDNLPLETFNKGVPMIDNPSLFSCKWCKKSILMTTAVEHINGCLKIKKEKANRKKAAREARERAKEQALREERERRAEEEGITLGGDGDSGDDDDEDKGPGGKSTKKVGGKKTGDGDLKGKKRKAEGEADKGPKQKKKKDEPKPKTKPKGPVDVERQCGVILPNGQPCARSLTCKSHSMGAKRAVAGRSLPYDMLLAAYQKKNQARQQKAALDANAPIEDDDDPNAGPVDSDEEYNSVMGALKNWPRNLQPVVPQPQLNFLKRETQLARLRHQLDAATDNGRRNIFKVNSYGAQRLPPGHPGHRPPVPVLPAMDQEDAPGEDDDVPMLGAGMPGSARSATFAPIPQQRQVSAGGPV